MCLGQWGYFWDCTSVPNGFAWMVSLLTYSQENPCTWLYLMCLHAITVTSECNPGQLLFCWCAGCSSVVSVTNRTEKMLKKPLLLSYLQYHKDIVFNPLVHIHISKNHLVCYLFYGSFSFYSFWIQVLRMASVLFCKELWFLPCSH